MTALIVRGDALRVPLRDNSVDLICTSPPYFSLRSYGTGHEMEVGSEATPQAYLEALWAATREMVRVLKPTGSIWINLGDKYNGAGPTAPWKFANGQAWAREQRGGQASHVAGIPNKSLIGLPWRYAIGCIDQLGLILRRDLIWDKPNGLPESVTDRPRSSHEYWFMFVKQPRYFAVLDELREPASGYSRPNGAVRATPNGQRPRAMADTVNPLGALPGSVWSIPSEPLRLPPWIDTQHYASFPSEWPRRLILGFTPHLICDVCKVGRFPVVDRPRLTPEGAQLLEQRGGHASQEYMANSGRNDAGWGLSMNISGSERARLTEPATILGYGCACTPYTDHPERRQPSVSHQVDDLRVGGHASGHGPSNGWPERQPIREYHLAGWSPPPGHPALVLDPFGGTGTVTHVARALGRHAITIDLSEAYCHLATDTTLARQRAGKVLGRVHQERQGTLL